MRVALVGRFPLKPDTFAGGLETSTANLLSGLQTLGDIHLHLLAFNSEVVDPIHVDRDGIHFHYLPSPARLNTVTLHFQARRSLKRLLAELNPDVVHALDALDSGYICLRSADEYPLVLSVHGIVREERKYASGVRGRLRATLASWLIERYCIKHADYLVEPTRYPEEYFGSLINGKIVDTGNPIGDSFFEIESDPEPGCLLYSGAIIPRKRLIDLIEAIRRLRQTFPTIVLRVAGGMPDGEYLKLVERSIASANLTENIILLGQLRIDQLRDEYRRCSFLVLPSSQETSPMVIGELMAAGKPVIATRVGGVPYLVQNEETGFVVEPGDIDALVDRIDRLLQDPDLRTRMGTRARQRAERRFRSQEVAKRVRDVYLEAIANQANSLRNRESNQRALGSAPSEKRPNGSDPEL